MRWLNWLRQAFSAPHPHAPFSGAAARAGAVHTTVHPSLHPSLHRGGALAQHSAHQLFTPELLQRAWLAVRRAGGGPGVDGVTLQAFARDLASHLEDLRHALVSGSYRPQPVRQVLVPKAGDGLRALAIWALRDRIAQHAVYQLIGPVFEATFLPCSVGFRPGLGVADAIAQVIAHRAANRCWIVDADIRNCFDTIDTARLMPLLRQRIKDRLVLRYIHSWLHAGIMNSMDGRPRKAGAAQGGVLSPLFANIYLHQMDKQLTGHHLALVRYADDFVICCRRRREAGRALAQVDTTLARLGLALHPQKTRIVHLDQGLHWLGHFFIRQECHRLA